MAPLWPIELPYGLSRFHHHLQTTGEGVAIPLSDQRFYCPSLSAVNLVSLPDRPDYLRHRLELQPLALRVPDRKKSKKKALKMGYQFPSSMKLPAKEQWRRTPRSGLKALPASTSLPLTRKPSVQTRARRPFRQKSKVKEAIVINDSDSDIEVDDISSLPPARSKTASSKSPITRRAGDSNWRKASIQTVGNKTPDLGNYRYTPRPAPHADLNRDLYQNGREVTLRRDWSVSQTPVPSIERQQSEASVIFEGTPPRVTRNPFPYKRTVETTQLPFRTSARLLLNTATGFENAGETYPETARTNASEMDYMLVSRSPSFTHVRSAPDVRVPEPDWSFANIASENDHARKKKDTSNEPVSCPPFGVRAQPRSKSFLDSSSPPTKSVPLPFLDTPPTPHIEASFSLANIPDFEMRKDVAQLMAVAPGVTVQDLHSLLVEMKGQFDHARDHVFKHLSQTPILAMQESRIRNPTVKPSVQPRHPSFSSMDDTVMVENNDEEEDIKIKIDVGDPGFYNDNHLYPSPSPPVARPRKSKKKKKSEPRKALKERLRSTSRFPQRPIPKEKKYRSKQAGQSQPSLHPAIARNKSRCDKAPAPPTRTSQKTKSSSVHASTSKDKSQPLRPSSKHIPNPTLVAPQNSMKKDRLRKTNGHFLPAKATREVIAQSACSIRSDLMEKITPNTDEDGGINFGNARELRALRDGFNRTLAESVDDSDCDDSYEDGDSDEILDCQDDTEQDEVGSDVEMEDFEETLHIDMIKPFLIKPIVGY